MVSLGLKTDPIKAAHTPVLDRDRMLANSARELSDSLGKVLENISDPKLREQLTAEFVRSLQTPSAGITDADRSIEGMAALTVSTENTKLRESVKADFKQTGIAELAERLVRIERDPDYTRVKEYLAANDLMIVLSPGWYHRWNTYDGDRLPIGEVSRAFVMTGKGLRVWEQKTEVAPYGVKEEHHPALQELRENFAGASANNSFVVPIPKNSDAAQFSDIKQPPTFRHPAKAFEWNINEDVVSARLNAAYSEIISRAVADQR